MASTRLGKSLAVRYSGDGRWLAVTTATKVQVLSADDSSTRWELKIRDPSDVRFSPDGSALLAKTTSGALFFHIVGRNSRGRRLGRSDGEGPAPEFAGADRVVNASWGGLLEILDVSSGASVAQQRFPREMITAVHRSLSGSRWVILHSPKATVDDCPPEPDYISIWEGALPIGAPMLVRTGLRFIRDSALHPSGERIAVVHGASPASLALVDVATGVVSATRQVEYGGTTNELAWSPGGRELAVIEREAVRIYDGRLEPLREMSLVYPCSVAYAPNGRRLAIGSWKNGVVLDTGPDTDGWTPLLS
jgi:dipeptidyl aminopeptidase/acylaminoacyl peptidase